jgi:hypothetical protein
MPFGAQILRNLGFSNGIGRAEYHGTWVLYRTWVFRRELGFLYTQFLKPKPNPQCRAWLGFGSSPGFQSISSDSMKYPRRACPNSPIALGGIVQLNLEERVVEALSSVIFDAFRVDKMLFLHTGIC